jgi:hypothetical protein
MSPEAIKAVANKLRFRSRALVLGIASLAIAPAAPAWHVERQAGSGCWPPRCEADQLPLATPVISHAGRLFMIGDGAAPRNGYDSHDGATWRAFDHNAGWGTRYKAADASFAGAMWRVGGWVEQHGQRIAMNDVWRSEDGRRWERVVEHAPWPARADAHLVVFRDTLWLIGGEPNDSRVWLTNDGQQWISRATGSLPRANPQGVIAFRNALWVIGHGAWSSATNDVWKSDDGSNWTRVTANAAWPARTGAGFTVLDDRLWVVAGAGLRDVWSSTDGRSWQRSSIEIPGPPRSAEYSAVFQNAFWVIGGKTGGAGGTGFWDGVVYLK